MSIIAWILLGIISGFIASKVVNGSGKGAIMDMVLGVIGAFVGGGLFHLVGHVGVTGFNLWSVFVSVIGAIVVLVAYHALTGGRTSTAAKVLTPGALGNGKRYRSIHVGPTRALRCSKKVGPTCRKLLPRR